MNCSTAVIASASRPRKATAPTPRSSTPGPTSLAAYARARGASGLVEEAAALERAGALLGGELDVPRGEQEDLVGDALHAAVERVGEPAREVDQPLRELGVGALQVED